jgi:DNA-directed RNA polymerase subunit RPC12/RpoP
MCKEKTVLIFGAGATAALGMPLTEKQNEFFRTFFFSDVTDLKNYGLTEQDVERFAALKKLKAEDEFNIEDLINFVKYFFIEDEESFKMIDLYNLIDIQIHKGLNLTMYESVSNEKKILYPHHLGQYRKGILVVLQEYFSMQIKKAQQNKKIHLYVDFFQEIGKVLLQEKGELISDGLDLRDSDFVFSNFSYLSFNWDVLLLWSMFIAHKNLNVQNAFYYHNQNQIFKLKVFNDFATFMTSKSFDNDTAKWYPYNESVAYRLNDSDRNTDRKVVLIPTFFPHGQTNWLDCPYCGKLSAYLGDSFKLRSSSLAMRSPLTADDYYKCVHCGSKLTTKDSAMLLQTLYKSKTPYLEEIQRAMRIKVEEAEYLIFIGYSLPEDDIDYKSFFRSAKTVHNNKKVFVVLKGDNFENRWYEAVEILKMISDDINNKEIILRYCAIFGKKNVFISMVGFPTAMDLVTSLLKTNLRLDGLISSTTGGV